MTDLDWGTIAPPHAQYGYGRVDAFQAILSISRGDVLNDDAINIVDLTRLVGWLFGSWPEPFPSRHLADCNCDGLENVADLTYLADHLFAQGPPPVKPCFKPWR